MSTAPRSSPAAKVPLPSYPKREMHVYDAAQVAVFLDGAQTDRLYAMYVLALDAGMRQGELFALQWGDIDFSTGSVQVQRSLEEIKGALRVKETKSPKSRRRITLSRYTLDALNEHRSGCWPRGSPQQSGPGLEGEGGAGRTTATQAWVRSVGGGFPERQRRSRLVIFRRSDRGGNRPCVLGDCGKLTGASFKEIYPRQEELSGKGLGNLIRFPLWNKSCFIDVENDWAVIEPHEALAGVRKTTGAELRELAAKLGHPIEPSRKSTYTRAVDDQYADGDLPPTVRYLLAEKSSTLYKRWQGNTDGLKDKSLSGIAESIVCILIAAIIPTRDIEVALRLWCKENDYEKGLRDDWIKRTVESGYTFVHEKATERRNTHAGADTTSESEINLTDLGNARRVLREHGQDIRFCHPSKSYLVFDGRRFKSDDTAEIMRRIKHTQGGCFGGRESRLPRSAATKDRRRTS